MRTNAGFLFNALTHPDFEAAKIDTGFIERNLDALVPDRRARRDASGASAAAVAILAAEERSAAAGARRASG